MIKKYVFSFLAVTAFSVNSLAYTETVTTTTTTTTVTHGHGPIEPAHDSCSDSDISSLFCSLTLATYAVWSTHTLDEASKSDILAGGVQGANAILAENNLEAVRSIIANDANLQAALTQIYEEKGNISVFEAAQLISGK